MSPLVKRLREARMSWVELGDGLAVQIIRPAECDMGLFRQLRTGQGADAARRLVTEFVVDWRGFSEELLFPGVGGSDALPFDREGWAEVVADRLQMGNKVLDGLVDAVNTYLESKREAEKN
jgi:hypothetical protein